MEKILIDIISGKSPILLYVNNTISIRPLTGFMGICKVEGNTDVALTSSYELSKFLIITSVPATKQSVIRLIRGEVLFYLQHMLTKEYMGVVWPSGNCTSPNISHVENFNDAISFRMIIVNSVILKELDLTTIFTGKADIRLKTTGNTAWNNRYLGVCGLGPCKTKSVGVLPNYSESILRILSTDLHKIYCCSDVTSIDKCETIPEYDCEPIMYNWCKLPGNENKNECKCINSKSLLPQCFDKECYENKDAYYKDKICERSHIDCVGIYTKIKKNNYTDDIKSVCGPYENLRNEYLEKGIYFHKLDIISILEDNWIALLIIYIVCVVYLLIF